MNTVTSALLNEGFERCPAAIIAIPGKINSNKVQTNHPACTVSQPGSIYAETIPWV